MRGPIDTWSWATVGTQEGGLALAELKLDFSFSVHHLYTKSYVSLVTHTLR